MEQFDDRFFPRDFDFYHLGRVLPLSDPTDLAYEKDLSGSFVVVFRVVGDELGTCSIVFEKNPRTDEEQSLSVELANILASKFVSQLGTTMGEYIELSPPKVYQPDEKAHHRMVTYISHALRKGIAGKYYEFVREQDCKIGLQMIYTPGRVAEA